MQTLKPRQIVFLLAMILIPALNAAPARADDGGVRDSTGLIWSASQAAETGSWWTWDGATARASSYSVYDPADDATYDDWRLPTIAELRTAIQDGTMNALVPRLGTGPVYIEGGIWALETKGSKAYVVQILRDPITWDVIGGGGAGLSLKGSAFEAFFVRGRAPSKR